MGRQTQTRHLLARLRLENGEETVTETYTFQDVDFGAGDVTQLVRGPANKSGFIVGVAIYNVSETFTDDTTEARVDIGTVADPDGYSVGADFGTLAATAALNPEGADGALGDRIIEDTDFLITTVAPTGGTPAGIATVSVSVAWS